MNFHQTSSLKEIQVWILKAEGDDGGEYFKSLNIVNKLTETHKNKRTNWFLHTSQKLQRSVDLLDLFKGKMYNFGKKTQLCSKNFTQSAQDDDYSMLYLNRDASDWSAD